MGGNHELLSILNLLGSQLQLPHVVEGKQLYADLQKILLQIMTKNSTTWQKWRKVRSESIDTDEEGTEMEGSPSSSKEIMDKSKDGCKDEYGNKKRKRISRSKKIQDNRAKKRQKHTKIERLDMVESGSDENISREEDSEYELDEQKSNESNSSNFDSDMSEYIPS